MALRRTAHGGALPLPGGRKIPIVCNCKPAPAGPKQGLKARVPGQRGQAGGIVFRFHNFVDDKLDFSF